MTMKDFAMPNGQDGTQPFYPPNGHRVLAQSPSPPLFSTGYRSPGVLLASDMHGPYAAGYYTYDRSVQPPEYTYHPDYRHLRHQPITHNVDLPDRFGGFDNAEKSFHRGVGQGNGGSSSMRNGDVDVNSKPASFETANPGASELRHQSNVHPSTGSSVRNGLPMKPKFTPFQATKKKVKLTNHLPKDAGITKVKRKTSDLVGDGLSDRAPPGTDPFAFDALIEELGMAANRQRARFKLDEAHLPGTEAMGKHRGNQSTPGAGSNEDDKFRAKLHPTASTDDGPVHLDQNTFNSKMREEVRKLGYSSPAELWSYSGYEPLSKRLGQLAILSRMFEDLLPVYVEGNEEQRMAMRDAMQTMAQSAFPERIDGLNFSPVE